ncbi:hypothetical protein SISNIDRAFT_386136, partial [Sistotremastrum niveocremeum HHB9708]
GPAIPRRDSPDVYDDYCITVLLLFKPWRKPTDLLHTFATHADALSDFLNVCSSRISRIIDNIQLLTECRDARN